MKIFRMTWKLVWEVYITHLLSCLNFIKIDHILFEHGQQEIKSQIIHDKTKHKPMFTSNKVQCANEKVQVITVINENL